MSDPMYDITMAASSLKVIAPEQFDRLIEAFKQLEEQQKSALISAGVDSIFNVQGSASIVTQLRKRLENCLEQRATYQNRT